MSAAFVLLLALATQGADPLPGLLHQLDDDVIDVRDEASGALVKLGRAILPRLEEARQNAGPELAQRIGEVIRRIGEKDRLSTLLPAPTLVTLRAQDRPLKEVLEALAKQVSTPLAWPSSLPEGRVTLALEKKPFWEALDEVCRASGTLMPEPGPEGIRLVAETYVAVPRRFSGPFALWLRDVDSNATVSLDSLERYDSLSARFQVAWEKGTKPDQLSVVIEDLKDDTGEDLAGGSVGSEAFRTELSGPALTADISFSSDKSLHRKSVRLASVRGRIDVSFTLQHTGVSFAKPEEKLPAAASCSRFSARLVRVARSGDQVRAEIGVTPDLRDRGRGEFQPPPFRIRDGSGTEHAGSFAGSIGSDTAIVYCYLFKIPVGAVLQELFARVPDVVHKERLDLDFKELPLR